MSETNETASLNFIERIIEDDLASGKNGKRVATRFPPEPNGYLHIGHAKSICLNFGLAKQYDGGTCNLRFDDTNPLKEDTEYVDSIQADVRWLGFDWEGRLYFASDYFEQIYNFAVELIKLGKAYICSLNAEQIREYRGTLTEPGKPSPDRDRPIEENLDLFARMRAGEFEDGTYTLRAKIDMASPNIVMRDPTLYRIRKTHHHRTGDAWCIYPMYDFTHCLSDSIESITHSICTLEFENHRPLYDWILEALGTKSHPQQIEFARLFLNYTVMSKRKLLQLVNEKHVNGWDDPRMPTIRGFRRRGVTPAAIRNFCERIGLARRNSLVDIAMLEHSIREDLNATSPRVMAVLDPIRLVIENYPEGHVEELDAKKMPEEGSPTRKVPFSRELYIERDDFREEPPRKFHRLSPGKEVRLKYAYYVTCTEVIKDDDGKITELRCTYDPDTRGGWSEDGRKVKGTLHWVSIPHALRCEARIYDRLFRVPNPNEGDNFLDHINPDSLHIQECFVEPSVKDAPPETRYQFERKGYYCIDSDSTKDKLVFNRTISLRDTWGKLEKQNNKQTKKK